MAVSRVIKRARLADGGAGVLDNVSWIVGRFGNMLGYSITVVGYPDATP